MQLFTFRFEIDNGNLLIIVLSDPRGTVPDEDYVGWVVQIPEDENPGSTLERIKRSAYELKKRIKYVLNEEPTLSNLLLSLDMSMRQL